MRSSKTPTPEQVERAVAMLAQPQHRRYFFDQLQNPEWIKALKEKGFFAHPPSAREHPDRETVSFPVWPEAQYLVRMASAAPEAVLETVLEIPETDNVRVHEDLADAALAMPPELAARLVPRACEWVKSPYSLLLPDKLGRLIAHLACGGRVEDALRLSRAMLELLPDPRSDEQLAVTDGLTLTPEPRPRFDSYYYEQILQRDYPELLRAVGLPALELLCDLLDRAVELSRRPNDDGDRDYSYVWRPAVEDHEQNGDARGVREILVSAVRDSAEMLMRVKGTDIPSIIDCLERRRWPIFGRMGLHVLRLCANEVPELVAARLTDRVLFEDLDRHHEFTLLLRAYFARLQPEYQETILGWIEEGPDVQRFKERQVRWSGTQPGEEEAARYAKVWQCSQLARIAPSLPGDWQQRYDELVQELGEPDHPDFLLYSSVSSWGEPSPKTADELAQMGAAEVAEFLRVWQPEDGVTSPGMEGLGNQLLAAASRDPEAFAQAAAEFAELDPVYVRSVLRGFEEAARAGRAFQWEQVLALCRWVVEQPREIPGRAQVGGLVDPDWGWARKAVGDLLSLALAERPLGVGYEHRQEVWEILEPLTHDISPTPEEEARYGGSNMDPVTLSINTVRGQALHDVIRYALWVQRDSAAQPGATDPCQRSFNQIPEARDVLERHLDIGRDPSRAIRAVYGQWFPWLLLLDREWATEQLAAIFPPETAHREHRDVAWEAYIGYCSPYDGVFDLLLGEYFIAVDQVGTRAGGGTALVKPDERLAQHLMTFYWRGKLQADDGQRLLDGFWTRAPSSLRGHALSFTGRALSQSKGEIPADVLQRLKALWESRLRLARQTQTPEEHKSEAAAFGWWFVSGRFEPLWSLAQLAVVYEFAGEVEAEHLVIERLASLAEQAPGLALRSLEAAVKSDQEGWRTYRMREHSRQILAAAMASGDPEAGGKAKALVDYLGQRGFLELRDLL